MYTKIALTIFEEQTSWSKSTYYKRSLWQFNTDSVLTPWRICWSGYLFRDYQICRLSSKMVGADFFLIVFFFLCSIRTPSLVWEIHNYGSMWVEVQKTQYFSFFLEAKAQAYDPQLGQWTVLALSCEGRRKRISVSDLPLPHLSGSVVSGSSGSLIRLSLGHGSGHQLPRFPTFLVTRTLLFYLRIPKTVSDFA